MPFLLSFFLEVALSAFFLLGLYNHDIQLHSPVFLFIILTCHSISTCQTYSGLRVNISTAFFVLPFHLTAQSLIFQCT